MGGVNVRKGWSHRVNNIYGRGENKEGFIYLVRSYIGEGHI